MAQAEEFSQTTEHGQLAVVPEASHLAPMENPDLSDQIVLDSIEHPAPATLMPHRRAPGR